MNVQLHYSKEKKQLIFGTYLIELKSRVNFTYFIRTIFPSFLFQNLTMEQWWKMLHNHKLFLQKHCYSFHNLKKEREREKKKSGCVGTVGLGKPQMKCGIGEMMGSFLSGGKDG